MSVVNSGAKKNAQHQILFQENPDGGKSDGYKNLNLFRHPHSLVLQNGCIYNDLPWGQSLLDQIQSDIDFTLQYEDDKVGKFQPHNEISYKVNVHKLIKIYNPNKTLHLAKPKIKFKHKGVTLSLIRAQNQLDFCPLPPISFLNKIVNYKKEI